MYSKNKDERNYKAMDRKSKFAILKYLLLGLALMILLPACKEKVEEDVYPKTIIVENPQWREFHNDFYFRINQDGTKSIVLPHDDSYEEYIIDEAKSVSVEAFKANTPVCALGKYQKQYAIYYLPQDFPGAIKGVAIIDEIELLDYDPYGFLTPPAWEIEE